MCIVLSYQFCQRTKPSITTSLLSPCWKVCPNALITNTMDTKSQGQSKRTESLNHLKLINQIHGLNVFKVQMMFISFGLHFGNLVKKKN